MRKLSSFVDHLPPESATMTALRNEAFARDDYEEPDGDAAEGVWSATEMLLATLIDEVRGLRYSYLVSHSKKGASISAPEPIRRPGSQLAARPRALRSRLTPEQRRILDPRLREEGS